jgi:hypothetical protein
MLATKDGLAEFWATFLIGLRNGLDAGAFTAFP